MARISRLEKPIVRIGVIAGSLPIEQVRSNPNLTKMTHFANFAAGYRIGRSIASHPFGEACGQHNHRGADEEFFVVSGDGIIEVGEVRYVVKPGDSIAVPAGIHHNLTGTSAIEPFLVLCDLTVAVGHEGDSAPWMSSE